MERTLVNIILDESGSDEGPRSSCLKARGATTGVASS